MRRSFGIGIANRRNQEPEADSGDFDSGTNRPGNDLADHGRRANWCKLCLRAENLQGEFVDSFAVAKIEWDAVTIGLSVSADVHVIF